MAVVADGRQSKPALAPLARTGAAVVLLSSSLLLPHQYGSMMPTRQPHKGQHH